MCHMLTKFAKEKGFASIIICDFHASLFGFGRSKFPSVLSVTVLRGVTMSLKRNAYKNMSLCKVNLVICCYNAFLNSVQRCKSHKGAKKNSLKSKGVRSLVLDVNL